MSKGKRKKRPVNRVFGNKSSQHSEQQKQEKVKEILAETAHTRRAEAELRALIKQFHGQRSILQLLPVIARRCPKDVLRLAVERVERKKHELNGDDLVLIEEIKALLDESKH